MARLPMYRQIADAIRKKISDGEYKVGTALPTEAQLREEFSCSRVTVRQALKLLIENGELESVQGSGTYVKENKVNYDIYQQTSFAEKWAHLNAVTHSDVVAFSVFDFAVNAGVKTSVRLAQLTVNESADGVMGPQTQKALNTCDAELFEYRFALAKITRYAQIVTRDRSQGKFLLGWINRTINGVQ